MVGAEPGLVRLGMVNRERQEAEYSVRVTVAGVEVATVGPISLAHGERWEQPVSFRPVLAGPGQEVLFLLYSGGDQQPCCFGRDCASGLDCVEVRERHPPPMNLLNWCLAPSEYMTCGNVSEPCCPSAFFAACQQPLECAGDGGCRPVDAATDAN